MNWNLYVYINIYFEERQPRRERKSITNERTMRDRNAATTKTYRQTCKTYRNDDGADAVGRERDGALMYHIMWKYRIIQCESPGTAMLGAWKMINVFEEKKKPSRGSLAHQFFVPFVSNIVIQHLLYHLYYYLIGMKAICFDILRLHITRLCVHSHSNDIIDK